MTNMNLVTDIAVLTEKVEKARAKVREAEVSKALIDQKRAELNSQLSDIGIEDWDSLDAEIVKAETAAKEALEALAGALVEAGIEV